MKKRRKTVHKQKLYNFNVVFFCNEEEKEDCIKKSPSISQKIKKDNVYDISMLLFFCNEEEKEEIIIVVIYHNQTFSTTKYHIIQYYNKLSTVQ